MNVNRLDIETLRLVAAGHKTNTELCKATGIGRRAMYERLQRLLAAGLIVGRTSIRDTRMTLYTLPEVTPAARQEAVLAEA